MLQYVRPVVKRRDTGELVTARMPSNVLERTAADVSLLAGMLVDKFSYHLPLHRQHRRMDDAGVAVSRSSLTNWTGRAIDLLKPVMDAQSAHVLERRVLAMDGRCRPGNWLFAWTEVGAERIGVIQSLFATCRLHEVDPYAYLVDVLQRVADHPAARGSNSPRGCGRSCSPTTR